MAWATKGASLAGELAGLTAVVADSIPPQTLSGAGLSRLVLPDTSKPPLIAALARVHGSPTFVLSSTPARARSLTDELELFLADIPLARLPEDERLPYEFARDDMSVAFERGRALALLGGGKPAVVVASWAAAALHCAPPEASAAAIELVVGAELGPPDLTLALESSGYEHEPYADRPGSYSRHGGLIDIFRADATAAVRVEFFGDTIDSIREIDIESQRSSGRVDSCSVPATAVGTASAREAARELLGSLETNSDKAEEITQNLELLSGGEHTLFAGFFEPLLFKTTAIAHMASNVLLVLDEPADGEEALETAAENAERAHGQLEGRGAIPSGLPLLTAPAADFRRSAMETASRVELRHFIATDEEAARLPLATPQTHGGRLREMANDLAQRAGNGQTVVVASQQSLRIAEIFDETGVPHSVSPSVLQPPAEGSVILAPLALSGGFELSEKLLTISDTEVFGFRKRRRPRRTQSGPRLDLVASVAPGDFLVHTDHGIARFAGLVTRTIEGAEREYLELQYAEGDRLFVPADQLDSLTRYLGPTDRSPSLTRLGSGEWVRARRRVRQAVAEMAHELLELYAKRDVAVGHAFPPDSAWQAEMEAAFPFVETPDQLQAIRDVKMDMERSRPMDRLICGDVGYGKTEVAIRAAFKVVMDGRQVAVLVPTTVLAEQHGATFRERMAGFPVRIEVLSRFRSAARQREIIEGLASGEIDVIVGTHRLLGKDVSFDDVALVVVDEEQRFGVAHKERLKQMKEEVDVLTLSATPIPRTMQMALSGVRDMSTVMTSPEDRLPIRTYVTEWDDEIVREAIDRELQRGGQVYFVHNRVQSIERVLARLRNLVPEATFAVGHGQMPEERLEQVMLEFAAGEFDVLVCTTIIESGLDIPSVNTIVIDNANQLGLAQLYQLRGRVGRAASRAYAYLLYDRNRAINEQAQRRLEAIFEATELGAGFQIALRDLEIRGAGNLLGPQQSGHIAAVGLELYTKLLAEAVGAIRAVLDAGADAEPPPAALAAMPIDLPVSAHIPTQYVSDLNVRLATYQRIADIEEPAQIAEMQSELEDRFGAPPPAVEALLFVALVKCLARAADVESVSIDEEMIHLRVRNGTTEEQRQRFAASGPTAVRIGPERVRLERGALGEQWTSALTAALRLLADESS